MEWPGGPLVGAAHPLQELESVADIYLGERDLLSTAITAITSLYYPISTKEI